MKASFSHRPTNDTSMELFIDRACPAPRFWIGLRALIDAGEPLPPALKRLALSASGVIICSQREARAAFKCAEKLDGWKGNHRLAEYPFGCACP